MDLTSQKQEVFAWLEELAGNEPVPEFELNATTLQCLHDMSILTQKKDRNVQLVVDDLQQKTDEYNAEAQRLSAVLSRLNLGPGSLSQSGSNSLRMLAKLGTLLDVRDTSDTCYFLALQELDNALEKVKEKQQSEDRQLEQLTAKNHSTLLKLNAVNKTLESVRQKVGQDQPVNEKRKNDVSFLHSKAKNYTREISKLQLQLADAKVDKAIFHENLVKKYETLKSLEDQLAPMKAELESYSSLPPDLTEVKIKIEQQKKELAELEKKVSECINMSLS